MSRRTQYVELDILPPELRCVSPKRRREMAARLGGRAGRRVATRIAAPWLLPPAITISTIPSPAPGGIGPRARHQTHRAAFCHQHADGPQVVAALSAAWPLGPGGKQPRSASPAAENPVEIEQQVLALRQKLPAFGAARLKREFDLPLSHMAMQRIWREHGLLKARKKKYLRKQDLAHIKEQWALFQQISADTKDLDDIPQYRLQAERLGFTGHPVHRARRSQRVVVLGFRQKTQRRGQRNLCFAHSSSFWTVLASRCAIWSGKPTVVASSMAIAPKPSATANTCAFRLPRTPTRATSRPCNRLEEDEFWNRSPARESLAKGTPINCIST
jgi:hypothetical protein